MMEKILHFLLMCFTIIVCGLMVLFEKVNASTSDVGFVKDIQIYNSNQVYTSIAGNPLCSSGESSTPACSFNKQYNFDFNYTHNTGDNQYLVFRFSYIIATDGSADDTIVQFQPSATIANTSGASFNCQIENGLIICPVNNNQTYNRLNIRGTAYYNILYNNIRWQIDNWAQVYKNILYQGQIDTATAIESQTQQQQQQHEEMMNDTVQDSNETTTAFEEFESFLPENGVVTQLITLPITLYTNILNNINGSCSSFSLGNIFGESLSFPCINLKNILGNNLWQVIDILFSGFFVLVIARKLIKVFNNFSSMKEGDVIGD